MQARDIMTARVATITADTPVGEIVRRLIERGVSGLPVVDGDGTLLGIVSEGDLMRRPELGTDRIPPWWLALLLEPEERAAEYVKTHGRVAKDIMSHPVVTVRENTEVAAIAELFEKHRIKRVPVLRGRKLVGIVTRANVLQGIVAASAEAPVKVGDRKLRTGIVDRLHREAGLRDDGIDVTVSDGVVYLWGSVPSNAEAEAARVLVEGTRGVKALRNHLQVVAPSENDGAD